MDFQCQCCWDGHDGDCECPECEPAKAEARIASLTAERDEARAEVERLTHRVAKAEGSRDMALDSARSRGERAEAAEAEVRDLRAKVAAVEALADEHERTCNPAPYTSERALIERLRASVGRTEPEGAHCTRHTEYVSGCLWCDMSAEQLQRASVRTEPKGAAGPWQVDLTCCGRDQGSLTFDSWAEADEFRHTYTSGPGVDSSGYSGNGYEGHQRSAVIRRPPSLAAPAPEAEGRTEPEGAGE